MSTPSVIAILKRHGVSAKKHFGQNFLIAVPTLENIVTQCCLQSDETVIEIGPGLGVMTSLLAAKAHHVIAIERDPDMLDIARTEFGGIANIVWLQSDILNVDLNQHFNGRRIVIVGNIPYNITSPIIGWILDHAALIDRAVLLMQKEVAERIAAAPGGKTYGALTVAVQACAAARVVCEVGPGNFSPPPEVTSALLRLDIDHVHRPNTQEARALRKVVQAAFGKRRKTLRNALIGGHISDAATIDRALAMSAIDGKRRPETLSVSEFLALTRCLEGLLRT